MLANLVRSNAFDGDKLAVVSLKSQGLNQVKIDENKVKVIYCGFDNILRLPIAVVKLLVFVGNSGLI